jgi:hypothetical protein
VLREFCQLAVTGMQVGAVSQKMYAKAAEALQLETEAVKSAIEALAAIFLECSKRCVRATLNQD